MKRIFLAALVFLNINTFAQNYVGEIKGKTNGNVIGSIGRSDVNLKVLDSALLQKLTAGIPVTGTFWQATQPISGTVTVNALTNSSIIKAQLQDNAGTAIVLGQTTMSASLPVTIASNQSSLPTTESRLPTALGQSATWQSLPVSLSTQNISDSSITGQSAQTATVNNILTSASGTAAIDATGYRSGSVQIVSTGTGGTFIFEGSNDNSNFQTIPVYSQLILTGTPIVAAITPTATNLIYVFPINCRYIRLRIATTITGGSIHAFTKLMQTPFTPAVFQVAQATTANLQTTSTQTGTWTVQPGNTANTTAWLVEQRTGTTNGSTTSTLNAAGTTNATNLKASAGMIYGITVMNASAAVRYLRIYNKASSPTVGTDVPIMVIAVPATSSKEINFSQGIKFSTGIGYATTTGAGATDNTAVTAGDMQILINWQ